jgi:hypothetical protein
LKFLFVCYSFKEKKQLAYGRILLLLILARTDKLNELEESKLIEYLEKAVGYSEHVITRTLFYEMADEILSKVTTSQQHQKNNLLLYFLFF